MRSDWPVWVEVRCASDDCSNAVGGRFHQNFDRFKVGLKRIAFRQGWRLITKKWSCPKCIAKAIAATTR